MSRWYLRVRIWLHRMRYRTEWLPFDDHVVAACDCGGCARIYRNSDSSSTVTDVSCPIWGWADRARWLPLPKARLLP